MAKERHQEDEGRKTSNQSSASYVRYSENTIEGVDKLVSTYESSLESSNNYSNLFTTTLFSMITLR